MADVNNFDFFSLYGYDLPAPGLALANLDYFATSYFRMRAYHTVSPVGFVYWNAVGAPDATAKGAPYPALELTDIVCLQFQTDG